MGVKTPPIRQYRGAKSPSSTSIRAKAPSFFQGGGWGWFSHLYQLQEQKPMLHNRPALKPCRKELRNNATPAESQLWGILQRSNLGGYKFRRQHSIGAYILDFYCPSARLAIELDGDSHFTDEAIEYDRQRTAYLNALHIKVLRFLNTDVYEDLMMVGERILEEITGDHLTTQTTPNPLLKRRRGLLLRGITLLRR